MYRQPDPYLKGRLFFGFVDPFQEAPDGAFVLASDIYTANISDHVQRNYMVRTRADGIPLPTDPNSVLAKAIWDGAQIILTDCPEGQDPADVCCFVLCIESTIELSCWFFLCVCS